MGPGRVGPTGRKHIPLGRNKKLHLFSRFVLHFVDKKYMLRAAPTSVLRLVDVGVHIKLMSAFICLLYLYVHM